MSLAIICEYNPFHAGHLHQLTEAKRLFPGESIVCIMSGNFVQRGEPAILDKWVRTHMALAAGADLVLELPTYYATAGAADFARAGVAMAAATGIADKLVFSVEPGAEPWIEPLAHLLVDKKNELNKAIGDLLDSSASFAEARAKAITKFFPEAGSYIDSPNTILAVEYVKAIYELGAALTPVILTRRGNDYKDDSTLGEFPSATALRKASEKEDITPLLPAAVQSIWQDALNKGLGPVRVSSLSSALNLTLSHISSAELAQVAGVAEGLENRILKESKDYPDWDKLLDRIATKRYPTGRLRRILLHTILGITQEAKEKVSFADGPGYLRVLGARSDTLLGMLNKTAALPIITSFSHLPELSGPAKAMIEDEIRFTDLYMSLLPEPAARGRGYEYRAPMIK